MPPIESTFGKLSIAAALPEGLKYEGQVLDKKGTADLYAKLADIGGDAYRIHAKKLQDVAAEAAADSGGYSVSLENLIPSKRLRAVRDSLQQQLSKVISDPSLTPDARDKAISETVDKFRPVFDAAVTQESEEYGGPLTKQFKSGAKGSKDNYASLVAGDLLYADPNFKNIPYPVLRGYAEGLQPHQYFAGAFGARQGLALLKLGTAAGGYAAKRLLNAAHRLRVTAHDSDKEPEQLRGLPVDVSDPDNEGALLAAPAGGFPRNTVLTYSVLNKLQSLGLKNIVVRSPTVGGPADGGVYARDVGVRDYGNIASVNENIGVQAAGAVSEPMTQTMISSKHGGGVSGSSKGQEGFPIMDRLISIPSVYSGGAAYAQRDGKVTAVTQAPQGGTFIDVTGPDGQVTKHYADQDRSVLRKVGDAVEAGDELTDGLTNPAEVVTHRGIGEGRRRFIEAFRSAAQSAGFKPSRRNLEIIATGLINHVRLNTEVGDYSPDEVVPYSVVEHNYKPREGAAVGKPSSMVGKYLESPVLHHTIGTRITNRVASELAEHGIDKVTAHADKPPFDAVMIRSHDTASIDPDWGVRFLGTHLQKNILQAAHTGRYTDTAGSSFVPALMAGGTALKAPNRGATGAGQSSPKPAQPNQENPGSLPKPGRP